MALRTPSLLLRLFYNAKPIIPRWVQIVARRYIAQLICKKTSHIWPIDHNSAQPPEGWKGWPEGKQFALVLCHDVDTFRGYRGVLNVAELEENMGFHSCFSFVPERYGRVSLGLLDELRKRGFDIAVHGLKHDGKLFLSKRTFDRKAPRINAYLKMWQAKGFTSPSMQRNLEWMGALNIDYSTSTFDTDPFEPEPDGIRTIFPFWVAAMTQNGGFVEMPYTVPQDSTLFVILQERNIDIWKRKLNWIAEKGGMALLNTHPDYMNGKGRWGEEEYPIRFYEEFLNYVKSKYEDHYWHVLPEQMARFWRERMVLKPSEQKSSKP
jgi:hypothetical protein